MSANSINTPGAGLPSTPLTRQAPAEQSLDSALSLPHVMPKGKSGFRLLIGKSLLLGVSILLVVGLVGVGIVFMFNNPNGKNNSAVGTSDQTLLEALANPEGELQNAEFNINLPTTVTGKKFIIQDAAGDDFLVADTANSRIGIGGFPEGDAKLQVLGDIMASGALLASGGSTTLSDQGLRIGSVLVCTSAGCVGTRSATTDTSTTTTSTPTGPVDADTLQGSPAAFFLNASNLNTGTLDDARLSTIITKAGNTFNGPLELIQLDASGNLPALNASALTSLNGSNISSGTLADARLSGNVSLLGSSIDSAEITNDSITDSDVNSAAAIGWSKISKTGSSLGDLATRSASDLSSGTLADARLSSNVALLNASQTFTAANIIRLNSAGAFQVQKADTTPILAVNTNTNTISVVNLSLSGNMVSHLVPGTNNTYDLGSPALYWKTLYIDNIQANTISSSTTTISGTTSTDFTINTDNATNDTENQSLTFFRGSASPNAVIGWDSTNDKFTMNFPLDLGSNALTASGGSLTSLNASNISSGTLADGRLSANVSLLGASIDSSEITDGTIANIDISSSAAIAYSKLNLTGSVLSADLAGSIADSKLSTISSAGKVADTALSANVTLQGNTFNGINQLVKLDGSGNLPALNASALTSLNGSNISSGTVADARLSGNVALLNASQTFTAAQGINVSSATAFQVQNAGTVLLLANTSTGQISFPNATSTSTAILIGGDATLYRSAANVLATTSTFLGARLTTAQRDAIPNGQRPTGAMIFNTTTNTYEYNAGSEVSPNWLPFRRQTVYSLAQWPPANPYQGQEVVLADTYNGKSFKWTLTYRPDLSASYPWDADTTNAYVVGQVVAYDNLSAYTHTYTNIWNVPLAGDYQAIGWWQGIAGSPTDSGTRMVCLGPTKSSTAASSSTCTTPAGAGAFWSLATAHDSPLAVNGLTAAQTIQADRYNEPGNTTTTQSHGYGLGIKPRRLSN